MLKKSGGLWCRDVHVGDASFLYLLLILHNWHSQGHLTVHCDGQSFSHVIHIPVGRKKALLRWGISPLRTCLINVTVSSFWNLLAVLCYKAIFSCHIAARDPGKDTFFFFLFREAMFSANMFEFCHLREQRQWLQWTFCHLGDTLELGIKNAYSWDPAQTYELRLSE